MKPIGNLNNIMILFGTKILAYFFNGCTNFFLNESNFIRSTEKYIYVTQALTSMFL